MSTDTKSVPSMYEYMLRKLQARVKEMRPGERLPSIRKLMEEHKVNQITLDRCLSYIEGQGRVVRKPRSGIFVTDSHRDVDLGSLRSVGVIVPSFLGQLGVGSFMEGLELAAAQSEWIVQVCNASMGHKHQMDFFRRCIASGTKAVIVLSGTVNVVLDEYCDQIRAFCEAGLHLVCVDVAIPGLGCDLVRHQGFEFYRQATEMILKQGCRKILFLAAVPGMISAQRFAGVHQAAATFEEKVDLRYFAVNVDHISGRDSHPRQSAQFLMQQMPSDADALIVGSTALYPTGVELIKQMGRTVTKDIVFVASVNEDDALRLQPTIALEKSSREVGRQAFELMADRIANPNRTVVDRRLPFRIIVADEWLRRVQ